MKKPLNLKKKIIYLTFIYNFFTSFGYFSDEENLKVLKGISRSLKKGGKFLIDLSNPLRVIKNFIRESWFKIEEGFYSLEKYELDPLKMLIKNERILLKDGKKVAEKTHYVRIYTPAELCFFMRVSGLEPIKFYGDWRDFSEYNENSRRLIIVAEKISKN